MAYRTARTGELPLTALARSAVAVRCRLSRLGLRGRRRRWARRALLWMADGRWRRRDFAHRRGPLLRTVCRRRRRCLAHGRWRRSRRAIALLPRRRLRRRARVLLGRSSRSRRPVDRRGRRTALRVGRIVVIETLLLSRGQMLLGCRWAICAPLRCRRRLRR